MSHKLYFPRLRLKLSSLRGLFFALLHALTLTSSRVLMGSCYQQCEEIPGLLIMKGCTLQSRTWTAIAIDPSPIAT